MLDWNSETLEKYKREAEYAYDLNPSDCTASAINCYEIVGKYLNNEPVATTYSYQTEDDIKQIKKKVNDFNDYISKMAPVLVDYLFEIITTFDSVFTHDIICEYIPLKQRKVNENALIKQSYTTFLSLDKSIKPYLDFIYDNGFVRFEDDFSDKSMVHIDYYNAVGWMLAHNGDDYLTESTYNHEMAHTLDVVVNPQLALILRENGFHEINSMLLSDITNYNIISKNKSEAKTRNARISEINYFTSTKKYLISLSTLYALSKLKRLDENTIKKMLSLKYDIDLTNISNFNASLSSIQSSAYLLSNIVSLHMFNVYKEDAEKGSYLYKKSLYSNRNDVLGFLTDLEFNPSDYSYGQELLFLRNKEINKNLELIRK